MRLPSQNAISLPFGSSDPPYSTTDRHNGVDFLPYPDITVYAPCDAKVILRPNNGKDGNGLYFYVGSDFHGLLHNDHYLVTDGEQVKEGQPIAIMGWTGYVVPASPAGTHCHWAIKRNGQFIDPMSVIDKEEEQVIMPDDGTIDNIYIAINDRVATDQEKQAFRDKSINDSNGIYYNKIATDIKNLRADVIEKQKQLDAMGHQGEAQTLKPGIYKVD